MSAGSAGAFGALSGLLTDMARVIAQLTHEEYRDSAVSGVSGSIGGHVRHCLDHVVALERALETGDIDYDTRRRRTLVETDRELAILCLSAAAARVARLEDTALARPLLVRSLITAAGRRVDGTSSVARELAFVISHTVHHNAQMALLVHGTGAVRLPGRFGVAPSTPHLAGAA